MTIKHILGLTAVAGLLVLAAPAERAQAMSLSNPGAAAAVQDASLNATTEVRWHGGWRRGGWHAHRGWHRGGWHRGGWHRRHW